MMALLGVNSDTCTGGHMQVEVEAVHSSEIQKQTFAT
jgi:hypothetical protein